MKRNTLIALGLAALMLPQADAARTKTARKGNTAKQAQNTPQQMLRPQFSILGYAGSNRFRDITFPEEMVTPETVGQPAAPGTVSLENAGNAETRWISTDTLRVTLDPAAIAPLTVTTIRVGNGLRSLRGNRVAPLFIRFCARSIRVNTGCSGSEEVMPTFLTLNDGADQACTAKFKELISKAEYVVLNKRTQEVVSRRSAGIRPATAGEALKYFDSFCWAALMWGSEREATKKELEKMDPAAELTGMWVAPAAGYHPADLRSELRLPGAKPKHVVTPNADCAENVNFESEELFSAGGYSAVCGRDVEYLGNGRYSICADFDTPVLQDRDPASLLTAFCLVTDDNNCELMTVGDDMVARVTVDRKDRTSAPASGKAEISVRVDTERTKRERKSIKLWNGETVEAYMRIYYLVDTQGEHCTLFDSTCYPTVLQGEYVTPVNMDKDGKLNYRASAVELAPPAPYLSCDVMENGMISGAAHRLQLSQRGLKKLNATVYSLKSTGADAVRSLRTYQDLYSPAARNRAEYLLEDSTVDKKIQDGCAPVGMLAQCSDRRDVALPTDKPTAVLDLDAVSGGKAAKGMYLVEALGEVLDDCVRKPEAARVVNQGLVQITDLGLVWKVSRTELVAYGYSLTTAAPMKGGVLHVMDDNGRELASVTLDETGMARCPLPVGAAFLQLTADDDVYTVRMQDPVIEDDSSPFSASQVLALQKAGIDPAELPQTITLLFTDRDMYRPGDTVHLKGICRVLRGNKLETPKIKSVKVRAEVNWRDENTYTVKPDSDGSFSLDLPAARVGSLSIYTEPEFEGDATGSSPDKAMERRINAIPELKEGLRFTMYRVLDREATCVVSVQDYRRNEFEVKSTLAADTSTGTAKLQATARNFTTTPLSGAEVNWLLHVSTENFCPKGWESYCFGDYRERESDFSRWMSYFGGGVSSVSSKYLRASSKLDAEGNGSHEFRLPEQSFPLPMSLRAVAYVTNAKEQSVRDVQSSKLHLCEQYAGLRLPGRFVKSGAPIPVQALVVNAAGTRYEGQPLSAQLTVTRAEQTPFRYGTEVRNSVQKSAAEQCVFSAPVQLSAVAAEQELPALEPGEYTVNLTGKDAAGHDFRTAYTFRVLGPDESAWAYCEDRYLNIETEKQVYTPGETARLLVNTPVDAEALISLEREGILRTIRTRVKADNPVVELPITAEDAPGVHVTVNLIQGANEGDTGLPIIRTGSTYLRVIPTEKVLSLKLDTPSNLNPTEDCTVSGVVTGADGKPAADAEVTLYAVDEGTLQLRNYKMPDPIGTFYDRRDLLVNTFSSAGGLLETDLRNRSFGNKGVFIGGGDEEDEDAEATAAPIRTNMNPTAVWLANVHTDAEGRFTATYKNSDLLTRYRVMAVAAAGADRFGTAKGDYTVTKPVMLEPAAPMAAAEGDVVDVPVTLSMLPEQLPAGMPSTVRWVVSACGDNAAPAMPAQTVELQGNRPVTISFPVTVGQAGAASLTWSVQPEDASLSSKLRDAVQCRFDVVPPTPNLRETVYSTLKSGDSVASLLKNEYRAGTTAQFSFSTNALAGCTINMQNLRKYPFGCVEQRSGRVLPWLFAPLFAEVLDMPKPDEADRRAAVNTEVSKIVDCLCSGDYWFTYWAGDTQPTNFSYYAALVLHLAAQSGCSTVPQSRLENVFKNMKRTLAGENSRPSLAGALGAMIGNENGTPVVAHFPQSGPYDMNALVTLAVAGRLTPQEFEQIRAACKKPSKHDLAVFGLVARMLNLPSAEEIWKSLPQERYNHMSHDIPLTVLYRWDDILRAASSPYVGQQMAEYAREMVRVHGPWTNSWDNGWCAIILHEYFKRVNPASKSAVLNGTPVPFSPVLRKQLPCGDAAPMQVSGDSVYVFADVDGYLAKAQEPRAVDKGLRISRRYERLMPDGSWKSTGSFAVGDIVRITLSCTCRQGSAGYMAVEDRLPATFEAIDPSIPSQCADVPSSGWHSAGFINHREFLKDRARFFTQSGLSLNGDFASYVARVVRSGTVTAPAAKAELMYNPRVYGLSVPQKFTVKPR
ncbi:MAG: hypothetical protein MSQ05_07670 [Akkermansia sp.]|nr:hypothetical protein [Akkermansia sp.]